MENGPELWNKILEPFKNTGYSAVVAGGAIRDYFLGYTPVDIDVFLLFKDNEEIPLWSLLDSMETFQVHSGQSEEYDNLSGVEEIREKEVEGWKVQYIVRNAAYPDGATLVEDFDFGITRSWFDGEIHDTRAAILDRIKNTVTLFKRPDTAWKRFNRFNKRHGNIFTPIGFPDKVEDTIPF